MIFQVQGSEDWKNKKSSGQSNKLVDDLIDVKISSSAIQINITVHKNEKFLSVAAIACDEAGWSLSNTRFLCNGERLQNNLTFFENDIEDQAVIEAVFEMVGGKGPSEDDILKMLDEVDSDSSEVDDHNNNNETTEEPVEKGFYSGHGEENCKLYEELKGKLNKGLLKLLI